MPSLYLGDIKLRNGRGYTLHAFTNGFPFREFQSSQISDKELYRQLSEARYRILEGERPIFCTAINPDNKAKTEMNPHDSRPGTVHITSLDEKGEVVCGLSIAVDAGERHNGELIGLPLENRWQPGDYPAGASLDHFRQNYIKMNYGKGRNTRPWEMAELYRHIKRNSESGELAARLGVYAGTYHLLTREAKKRGTTPTWLWVFDAVPEYFNLYRYAGAAVLRDPTLENPPRFVSPHKREIKKSANGNEVLLYKGKDISRAVLTPIPHRGGNGELLFEREWIPFLDGVVDVQKTERAVIESPFRLSGIDYEGFTPRDKKYLRGALSIIAARVFKDKHPHHLMSNLKNHFTLRNKNIDVEDYNFNGIGKTEGVPLETMYAYDI